MKGRLNAALGSWNDVPRGRGGVWATSCLQLFRDLVYPFARRVLGRLDLLLSLATQNADEAPDGVRLPVRGLHDLGKRGALGAAHLLRGFGLLGGFALALGFARSDAGLPMLSLSIGFALIGFSLTGLRSL